MRQLTLWDSCHTWGNPLGNGLDDKPHSDSRYFRGNTYALLKAVIEKEWLRTYVLWRRDVLDIQTNADELLEVAYYFKEATDGKYTNVQDYIAVRVGSNSQRVARLLQLISIDIFLEEISNYGDLGQKVHYISEGVDTTWKPSKQDVRRKMAGMKRICAGGFDGCLEDSSTGKVPLCLPCHRKANNEYGASADYPHWLLEEIKRIENEHRKAARDACYEDYHGTMSIDELESYLDAG